MIYNSKTVQDIFLKFSPFVTHMSVVNWWKKFGRSTTNMSATPLFVSKLCEGLAPILFEIWSKKFFWWGSRPISVTQWQEFQISPKKWRFEIFGTSAPSRGNRVIHALTQVNWKLVFLGWKKKLLHDEECFLHPLLFFAYYAQNILFATKI